MKLRILLGRDAFEPPMLMFLGTTIALLEYHWVSTVNTVIIILKVVLLKYILNREANISIEFATTLDKVV